VDCRSRPIQSLPAGTAKPGQSQQTNALAIALVPSPAKINHRLEIEKSATNGARASRADSTWP